MPGSSFAFATSSPIAPSISTYIFCTLMFIVCRSLLATQPLSLMIDMRICSVPIMGDLKRTASR